MIEFKGSRFSSRSRTPSKSDCGENKWAVKSRRKASVKTVKRKGKNQRKRRKVVATIREPNIQSTERDQKQNVIAAMNSFYFQVLCLNVFQFQPKRNVFYSYDDESFVRNLESCEKSVKRGKPPGHNKCSPFSFFFGPGFL